MVINKMERTTMTVQEAAEYLGVHSDTIYTMVRAGQIPHVRARRKILFRKNTLDEWMKLQERINMKFHDTDPPAWR